MKNIFLALSSTILCFIACQNAPKAGAPAVDSPAPVAAPKPATATTCYEMQKGKDITAVELTLVANEVSGFYAWEPDQKDGARGMFKGKKVGDMITADLTYMIEGSIQSEEIVFKMDGDKMRQANGPMDDKNGKMVIKDLAKAEWSDVFMPLDCAMIKAPIGRAVEVHGMIVKQQGN